MSETAITASRTRVGISALESRLNRERSTISRWCRVGTNGFPRPHYIGARRAWFLDEVEAWEREQMERAPAVRVPPRDAARAGGEA